MSSSRESASDVLGVVALGDVVEFLSDGVSELVGDTHDIDTVTHEGVLGDPSCLGHEDVYVGLDDLANPRALNLDGHSLAAGQGRDMHLPE